MRNWSFGLRLSSTFDLPESLYVTKRLLKILLTSISSYKHFSLIRDSID